MASFEAPVTKPGQPDLPTQLESETVGGVEPSNSKELPVAPEVELLKLAPEAEVVNEPTETVGGVEPSNCMEFPVAPEVELPKLAPETEVVKEPTMNHPDANLCQMSIPRVGLTQQQRPPANLKRTLELTERLRQALAKRKAGLQLMEPSSKKHSAEPLPSTSAAALGRPKSSHFSFNWTPTPQQRTVKILQNVPSIPLKSKEIQRKIRYRNKTPEQVYHLEKVFQRRQKPRSTDMLDLVQSTRLSIRQILRWFSDRRKMTNVKDNRRDASEPESSGTAVHSATNDDGDDGAPQSQTEPPQLDPLTANCSKHLIERKFKYLKDPNARTTDNSILRKDFEKVSKYHLEYFYFLLNVMWERKAQNIMKFVSCPGDKKGAIIMRESRRVREKFRVDLFSDAQKRAVAWWKETFLDKITRNSTMERAQTKHLIEEYLAPWIAPFIYGRGTTQDGRHLTLEIAIQDFSRLFHVDEGTPFKWETPAMISF